MFHRISCLVSLVSIAGCLGGEPQVQVLGQSIVYDSDSRREVFQVQDPAIRARAALSSVVLVPRHLVKQAADGVQIVAPSAAEADGLCPDEPFAAQPAAALCSGVLVDWDLVLTSGHCTRVLPAGELLVVFGYHYAATDQMRIDRDDVHEIAEIVLENLGERGHSPRLDYAWLKLRAPVSAPREPVPVRTAIDTLRTQQPLVFIGAGGGLPLKVDQGGAIFDLRAPWRDYFVASTDSARGASGGGAYDGDLALLGVLSRGGPDLQATAAGCMATVRRAPQAAPEEEFTYVARALEQLCATDPAASSLCRADCGDPCQAQPPSMAEAGGCSVATAFGRGRSGLGWLLVVGAVAAALAGRRRDRRPCRRRCRAPAGDMAWE
jgi:Trypsin-like peptidase domain